jgi:hypothetical protein
MGEPRAGQVIRLWIKGFPDRWWDATVVGLADGVLTIRQWRIYNGPEERAPQEVITALPMSKVARWGVVPTREAGGDE